MYAPTTPFGVPSRPRLQTPDASCDLPRRSTRIALVCDWYAPRIGGIERHLTQLAEHLAAAGQHVTVITPTKGPPSDIPGVRLERMSAFLFPRIGLIWTPTAFRRLGTRLRAERFDVVHVHSSIISPAAHATLYHAQKAGLPTVSTTHSILGGYVRTFRQIDRLVHWSRWPILFSAVSDRVAREIRPMVSPRPVMVLPNAVDPEEWRLRCPSAGTIAIACVMRLVPRKRGEVLLRSLAAARAGLPDSVRVCLHIAGDGPERAKLERLATSLGIAESVNFLGAVTVHEVKALLATSHFFVLASRLEAFGIAALEARAAGLPIVAMRESGVSEFIEHGVDGLLADNDQQFADHLRQLCSDARLRETLAEHNQQTTVTCCWNGVLAKHFAAYDEARRLCRKAPV